VVEDNTMSKFWLWSLPFLLLEVGCQRNQTPQTKGAELSETPAKSIDTVLQFHLDSRKLSLRLPVVQTGKFEGFQRFIDTLHLAGLPITHLQRADVDGDGQLDECVAELSLRNSLPFVLHVVKSAGTVIWSDTLVINDAPAGAMYWNENESSYVALKPYSGLYVAQKFFLDFIGNEIDTNSAEFGFLEHANIPLAQDLKKVRRRPRWIWGLHIVDPAQLVWDRRVHRFVTYAAP
jgi:hypothetical protein